MCACYPHAVAADPYLARSSRAAACKTLLAEGLCFCCFLLTATFSVLRLNERFLASVIERTLAPSASTEMRQVGASFSKSGSIAVIQQKRVRVKLLTILKVSILVKTFDAKS